MRGNFLSYRSKADIKRSETRTPRCWPSLAATLSTFLEDHDPHEVDCDGGVPKISCLSSSNFASDSSFIALILAYFSIPSSIFFSKASMLAFAYALYLMNSASNSATFLLVMTSDEE
ncbi:hypothetical protein Tco_1413974 [Tanacetum coccineum]